MPAAACGTQQLRQVQALAFSFLLPAASAASSFYCFPAGAASRSLGRPRAALMIEFTIEKRLASLQAVISSLGAATSPQGLALSPLSPSPLLGLL